MLVATALLAALVLRQVLTTIFLALTVVVVARPLYRRLLNLGIQRHVASAITTLAVFVAVVVVAAPIGFILYARRGDIEDAIETLPDDLTLAYGGASYTVETADVQTYLTDIVSDVAIEVLGNAPQLVLLLTLFTVVVFGVLLGQRQVGKAVDAIVPAGYERVYAALKQRTVHTLQAIYVLQLATGIATFVVAVPVFYVLGYEYYVTLAVICGLLQFFPIIGPSVVLAVLAGYHLAHGDVADAIAIIGLGGVLIAILPDAVVRPYLARAAADMPATLYFVGFIGGLLSLGPVGVIAGPLVVALLAEAVELLAEELRNGQQSELPDSADPPQ
ncbi:hypothetical protein L593_07590 [Salinarchaeum sp. Harcht-Bsk1]|nr:hypothetical protein L593_07590 [Salinarchaeum sp. Harcht-Bsk1]